MGSERMFPIMLDAGQRSFIPWSVIAPHEQQARRNHGDQSLEMLARRGGLSPSELAAVLQNRSWNAMPMSDAWTIIWQSARATDPVREGLVRALAMALADEVGWVDAASAALAAAQ